MFDEEGLDSGVLPCVCCVASINLIVSCPAVHSSRPSPNRPSLTHPASKSPFSLSYVLSSFRPEEAKLSMTAVKTINNKTTPLEEVENEDEE